MKQIQFFRLTLLLLLLLVTQTAKLAVGDLIISSGSASWTLSEGQAAGIFEFDAYFGSYESTTRSQVLSLPAPGNEPFTETDTNVQLNDPIRAHGASVPTGTPGATRSPQATNLVIENSANILGSWTAGNDIGAFVSGTPTSEQIAFSNMQRYTGPFTGSLIYGDFALRYSPSRVGVVREGNTLSGLVLTSNIDFLNAAFADIGNASITILGDKFNISGDLLMSDGLSVLSPDAVVGRKFGNFSMTATVSAVPEPSSLFTAGMAITGLISVRRRKREFRG